jgi:hypothetical protein
VDERQSHEHEILTLTHPRCRWRLLRIAIPQNSRCGGRLRLKLRYLGVVFRREIQQPFLGEGVGVFREATAAF